jgi:hypothetical protein
LRSTKKQKSVRICELSGIVKLSLTDELLQAFTIRAKKKKLQRLKDVAAYIVAQYLSCHSDVEDLQVPFSLRELVKPYGVTIPGDSLFDLNEN